jgi:hypothetical protein
MLIKVTFGQLCLKVGDKQQSSYTVRTLTFFSGRRDGLQGYADAQEEARQESGGGKYACAHSPLLSSHELGEQG